ncbi:HAMP domain-containing sensor histidine kinase [Solwaraspora sp. WMMD406]|uniref:sensor histidine kinase n=1 Tax=Solwaraspora sp. WMMD406 TaxID=3016095 RepID=UPI002417C071|nr:HAMP domain-containing sensor histidine kinase [Solwaraspora sp. WMMD406]MDG4765373.1 HAMP domain-containing sensor histidine kinase [Solwaraspora sp. WMMD406]
MRRRLTLLVAATTTLVLVAFLVPLALLLRTVAQDRAVVAANADVQSLVSLVGTADPDSLRLTVDQLAATADRPVTVYLPDGTILGDQVAPTPAVRLATLGRSLTTSDARGREILVAVQGRADGTAVIRTFVSVAELNRGVHQAWAVLAGLGAVLILLGLAVADRLARRLVRPITELSVVSHRLANAELDARAQPGGPPELREVAGALNHLAGRIQDLLREERERVADLSHRLRTPLTALRLEAESLADPADTARVTAGVDALERAVTGLIRQARRRSAVPDGESAAADAARVVRERVEFWSVLAEDTGRAVSVDLATGPVAVGVAVDDLAAAVDALLGNVFAHTPDNTGFAVTLAVRAGGGAVVTIADNGPGMPAGLIHRGASQAGSTGLGLDIARRAAQASGGRLGLDTGSSGAVVTLELGPPATPVGPATPG